MRTDLYPVTGHLGELPHTRNQTWREKYASDHIQQFIRNTERDRPALLWFVVQGRAHWRYYIKRHWRYLHIDDDLIDQVFSYLVVLAGPNPAAQLVRLTELNIHGQP